MLEGAAAPFHFSLDSSILYQAAAEGNFQSNILNGMPKLPNILQILSKNDALGVKIVSIIVNCPELPYPVHWAAVCL